MWLLYIHKFIKIDNFNPKVFCFKHCQFILRHPAVYRGSVIHYHCYLTLVLSRVKSDASLRDTSRANDCVMPRRAIVESRKIRAQLWPNCPHKDADASPRRHKW